MINNFLTKYSPPGLELKQEKAVFAWGISLSVLYSTFDYFARFVEAHHGLYERINGKLVLNVNATMPNFRSLLSYNFIGFAVLSVIMLGFIIYHYAYYRQGSMSIYLMKRLPKKQEMHKRALTLPILVLLICLATALVLLMIYFTVYMLVTPKACLAPNQWQILWRLF